jgi:aminoglycoside 6'-N-acetyltransferase
VALDIGLGPEFQNRSLGSEALRTVVRWLIAERGHHRFTIDPAVANERAIRAYAAVGFRPVGVLRRYERGPEGAWEDGLLMDLLAEELR